MKRFELGESVLINSDNMEVLKSLPDNSIDSVVTDPPYGISFMAKKWDYDVPSIELWKEVLRVLKPGGHLLCACGTRTQHRMVVNIEDAGFEIRDVISWVYGSGFPKSLNIGKAIDKIQGNEREVVGKIPVPGYAKTEVSQGKQNRNIYEFDKSVGTSPYEGWGTALKPACEFFTLARKPISESNIAENVLKWGTGGINIDECRVEGQPPKVTGKGIRCEAWRNKEGRSDVEHSIIDFEQPSGRFPANFIHDGSEEVVKGFPDNTSRFFYVAKASPSERNEGLEGLEEKQTNDGRKKDIDNAYQRGITLRQNHHPTVKPIALMEYLIRLITPKRGTVLDPFAGSGTTGIAAINLKVKYILIEREADYIPIINARLQHWQNKKDHEPGDLFEEVI